MPLKRKYIITSPFGMRRHPITGAYTLHEGIDIKCSFENVYNYADGIARQRNYHKNLGLYLDIEHDGYITRYQHLSKTCVDVGDYVEQEQLIAISGNTGLSTGPHLHFGIKYKGEWVNPELFSPFKRIDILVNDKKYKGVKDLNGKTYVEVREVFEDLNARVDWKEPDSVEVHAKTIKNAEEAKKTAEKLVELL